MSEKDTVVAVYETHDAAEVALRKVAESGLDMRNFSIVGRGYHTDEKALGFYSAGDRVQFWGSRGAYWGGLWGLLFGGMMLAVPVIGPVMIAGSLATVVFAAIASGVEGAVVAGGLGALGAALFSIGIPEHSVIHYEQALSGDQFILMGHGPLGEIGSAVELLKQTGPRQLDRYAGSNEPAMRAA